MRDEKTGMALIGQAGDDCYERPELIALPVEQLVHNVGGPVYDPCTCACYQAS